MNSSGVQTREDTACIQCQSDHRIDNIFSEELFKFSYEIWIRFKRCSNTRVKCFANDIRILTSSERLEDMGENQTPIVSSEHAMQR